MELIPTIGVEIHVQLKTKSKMFSKAPNTFGLDPNSQVMPLDMAFPGTMPVVNKEAVSYGIKVITALNMKLAKTIEFDRKNYFYPDLTKGYPFAFQVLGYLTWNHHGDYNAVRGEYEQYLSEFVYDKIWSELSQKDRMVARGIADVEGGKIKDIREYLHMETNEFNPYRKRLIKKGILSGETRGYVYFTLPLFEKYVMENY